MDNIWLETIANASQTIEQKIIRFAEFAPQVSGAILLFLFGFILAQVVYRAIIALSNKLKLETISEKIGLSHYLKAKKSKFSSSHVIAKAVRGFLVFFFFMESTRLAGLTQVADFLGEVMGYIPDIIIAIFIMLVGLRIGNTVHTLIRTSLNFAHEHTANALGLAGKYTLITFAILASLSQLQIAEILINSLFIGFVAMLALAGGLSFGLGGKDVVKELLDAVKKIELKERKKKNKS